VSQRGHYIFIGLQDQYYKVNFQKVDMILFLGHKWIVLIPFHVQMCFSPDFIHNFNSFYFMIPLKIVFSMEQVFPVKIYHYLHHT
jgi:hypothetical protein